MAKKNSARKTTSRSTPRKPLVVQKTYKMYVGGAFPRTESGRFYQPVVDGKPLANVCLASRKDIRNAIVAARAAQTAWASRTAYNRSQILYRIAEMLQDRFEQFRQELVRQGLAIAEAGQEVQATIDRWIYYAGWCDKYQQIFSCVNPVASNHFNFSVLEPTGVVVVIAHEEQPLLGLVSLVAPIIAGGNTCVVVASESKPLSAVTLGEVLQASDVPGGVVNTLTGKLDELVPHFASHMDVNAIANDRDQTALNTQIRQAAAINVKRVKTYKEDWASDESTSPYLIFDFSEVKTTWHPIERITASGSGY